MGSLPSRTNRQIPPVSLCMSDMYLCLYLLAQSGILLPFLRAPCASHFFLRQVLHENEKNIEHLEVRLEKAIKACNAMVDAGRQFAGSQKYVVQSCWEE